MQMPTEAAMREMLTRLSPVSEIRRLGGRRDLVRNAHGQPLPCCWAECWSRGSTRYSVRVPHDAPERNARGDTLEYIFCGPAHKSMWLGTSTQTNNVGNLWTGPASGRLSGPASSLHVPR